MPLHARCLAAATIVIFAAGCDKAKPAGGARGSAEAAEAARSAVPQLDLSTRPDILFQVFGERDDPRMIPVAAIRDGTLLPIELSNTGWRRFDGMYLRSGTTYTLYHDGMQAGSVSVRQGMWEKADDPLYSLAKCEQLVPLASVAVTGVPSSSYTIEYFASGARLGKQVAGQSMPPADVAATAKRIGYALGKAEEISQSTLDSLDFRAVALPTGATSRPTIIASFIDPSAGGGDANGGESAHVFAIADAKGGSAYTVTFDHVVKDPTSPRAEYRRYVDHLDLDGNGVDEIILEGWQEAGKTYLIILSYREGKWQETFRGRSSWCLDAKG